MTWTLSCARASNRVVDVATEARVMNAAPDDRKPETEPPATEPDPNAVPPVVPASSCGMWWTELEEWEREWVRRYHRDVPEAFFNAIQWRRLPQKEK